MGLRKKILSCIMFWTQFVQCQSDVCVCLEEFIVKFIDESISLVPVVLKICDELLIIVRKKPKLLELIESQEKGCLDSRYINIF